MASSDSPNTQGSRFGAIANAIRASLSRTNSIEDQPPIRTTADGERDFSPPPLSPVSLQGYADSTKSRVLSSGLCEEIRGLLPARLQLYDTWHLVYSLEQHGASLHTLYHKNTPQRGKRPGHVLVVKDQNGNVFGSYVNEYFHPMEGKRFYGNGECFLWKTKSIPLAGSDGYDRRFQAFPYTGLNDFVIYCTSTFLSMGGGDGHYGIWIDDNLDKGVSSRSLTFGNESLSETGDKFSIISLEVWRVG